MKAVMLMFDSLNRMLLEPYGCTWTKTHNFQRLAERTVQFDNCYAGSLPCMPARRELHTGRYNFLHRSWGPIEPYDDSMPSILNDHDIYTHLVSDHAHYWEDGGATYHNRYSSWEDVRGQEGDHWKCLPELLQPDGKVGIQNKDGLYFQETGKLQQHEFVNREFEKAEDDTAMARTVSKGIQFIENNHNYDHWFLQIECFDPHEPFYCIDKFKNKFPDKYKGPIYDWPPYHTVTEDPVTADHLRKQYAALLYMCDCYLGKVLDVFDQYDLWKDTMLIVNTDHGYLLGEHGWWSKVVMPCYDPIVHIPLFIYDPRFGHQDEKRSELVQTIDIPATILEYFGIALPEHMQGRPIRPVIEKDSPIRKYALFGIHGAHVNITDGRYVYMKSPLPDKAGLINEYTLLPLHMRSMFTVNELHDLQLMPGNTFSFTKGCPVMKIPKGMAKNDFSKLLTYGKNCEEAKHINNNSLVNAANFGDKLFDLQKDPDELRPLTDSFELEKNIITAMREMMKANEAPFEQYERLGIPRDGEITTELVKKLHHVWDVQPPFLENHTWTRGAVNAYYGLLKFIPKEKHDHVKDVYKELLGQSGTDIDTGMILKYIPNVVPEKYADMIRYFVELSGRTE